MGLPWTVIAVILAAGADLPPVTTTQDFANRHDFAVSSLLSSSTASPMPPPEGPTSPCPGVDRCLAHPNCSVCLIALNASLGIHTFAQYAAIEPSALARYQDTFFQTLDTRRACGAAATPTALLEAAVAGLTTEVCSVAFAMPLGLCLIAEFNCFVDPACRDCWRSVLNPAVSTRTVLSRASCAAATPLIFGDNSGNLTLRACLHVPLCSYSKLICANNPECRGCLATLEAGDPAAAARTCADAPVSTALGDVVTSCLRASDAGCGYWTTRCDANPNCAGCVAEVQNGNTAAEVARGFVSPACRLASTDNDAVKTILAIADECSAVTPCRGAVTAFWHNYHESAGYVLRCVSAGSLTAGEAQYCAQDIITFGVTTVCAQCPTSVHVVNSLVLATAVLGGLSVPVCLWVVATVVARGQHRTSMRDRIVIGLMAANAVYSAANACPLGLLRSGNVASCGQLALSLDLIRWGRAAWFGGKFALVACELVIVGASLTTLRRRAVIPRRVEALLHAACFVVGVAAAAVFYAECAKINAGGYNDATEEEGFTNAFDHLSDDLNDDLPSIAASARFARSRDAYDTLVQRMLIAWDVCAGCTIALWVCVRIVYRRALADLAADMEALTEFEQGDEWRATRRSGWRARLGGMQAQRAAFADVAIPLEPYLAVFLVFLVPAVVMSTDYCQKQSGAELNSQGSSNNERASAVTFGVCDVGCELALAFRSLCTVAVFLASPAKRADFVKVGFTVNNLCCWPCWGVAAPPPLPPNAVEVELNVFAAAADPVDTDGLPVGSAEMSVDVDPRWQIPEAHITRGGRLGVGSCGEVLQGVYVPENTPIAIKTLFSSMTDAEGDLINPDGDVEFRKEVAALQRVDHAHLLKFFGFGTTASGGGFIVTELVLGGSLEAALHDARREFPWRHRVSIALQISLGMEYLHELQMVHRDLKSANVLLDSDHELPRAKICDFGLARVTRPQQHHFVFSPFTGIARQLPIVRGMNRSESDPERAGGTASRAHGLGQFPKPSHRLGGVTHSEATCTMTKAAGTLLWMAPEVFRGDRDYSNAVDVYSFGLVMFEIATRETPWRELETEGAAEFFEALNTALQTGRRPRYPDALCDEFPQFVLLMRESWAGDPVDRPPFAEVSRRLAECLRVEVVHHEAATCNP